MEEGLPDRSPGAPTSMQGDADFARLREYLIRMHSPASVSARGDDISLSKMDMSAQAPDVEV
jgi:hypothetical protein